jgi:hypothetical protein
VTHQLRDAFFIATHEAIARGDDIDYVPVTVGMPHRTEFIMLKDGRIAFEGTAEELRGSTDAYLKAFLG